MKTDALPAIDNSPWPKFIASKVMPDGKLAVAITRSGNIYVGVVSLNGLNIEANQGDANIGGFKAVQVRLVTIGNDFIVVPLDKFDKLSYYNLIPAYKDVKLLENS